MIHDSITLQAREAFLNCLAYLLSDAYNPASNFFIKVPCPVSCPAVLAKPEDAIAP